MRLQAATGSSGRYLSPWREWRLQAVTGGYRRLGRLLVPRWREWRLQAVRSGYWYLGGESGEAAGVGCEAFERAHDHRIEIEIEHAALSSQVVASGYKWLRVVTGGYARSTSPCEAGEGGERHVKW